MTPRPQNGSSVQTIRVVVATRILAGDEHSEEVIDLCFAWMGLARRGTEADWDRGNAELKALGETRFDFSEKRGAADTAADRAAASSTRSRIMHAHSRLIYRQFAHSSVILIGNSDTSRR